MPAAAIGKDKDAPVIPKPWKMPKPQIPLVVWKNADYSGNPCTALVLAVYNDTLDVMVFSNGISLPLPKTGCRHKDDPTLASRTEPNPGGIFELCGVEQKIQKLCDQLLGPED